MPNRTITQRFVMPSTVQGETCEVDIEADCRLCFFVEKNSQGEWKNHFFKGFYEKDKAIPVDPRKIPQFDEEKLATFPDGYRESASEMAVVQEPVSSWSSHFECITTRIPRVRAVGRLQDQDGSPSEPWRIA